MSTHLRHSVSGALDLHTIPQATEVAPQLAGAKAIPPLRLQQTSALWSPDANSAESL